MNRESSKLAALSGIRQVEASLRADRAVDAAGLAVRRVWGKLLALAKRRPHWGEAQRAVHDLFGARITDSAIENVAAHLSRTARWGHKTAKANLETSLPAGALQAAAAKRIVEGRENEPLDDSVFSRGRDSLDHRRRVRFLGVDSVPSQSSAATLESAPSVADVLFPSYTSAEVAHVVYSSGWEERLRQSTRLAAPDRLASILAAGLAAGKSQREIAKNLLPAVMGVQATARRIARTETMRVAQDTQMRCHDQLGDLVIGFQVHATLDSHTRPWHARRSGQIYYKRPKPGQLGPYQMPNPPEEPRDPSQRPPGTPAISWNCRCMLTPVLSDPGDLHPSFTPATAPDPLVYHEWFSRADEHRRRVAVGAKRYATVERQTGRRPEWSDFLNHVTGDLLSHAELKAETVVQRHERASKVRSWLEQLRRLLLLTSAAGFLPGQ